MNRLTFMEKVKNDAIMFSSLIVFVVFLALTLIIPILVNELFLAFIYVPFVLVSGYILSTRSKRIDRILEEGYTSEGRIVKIRVYSRNPSVLIEYQYDTETYKTHVYVNKRSFLKNINIGDSVKILIDSSNPKKILIKELFDQIYQ